MQGDALLQGPCLYTDKGYNISVLIYRGINLQRVLNRLMCRCVGVQKKCYDQ
jgi:hypothetical protein